MDWRSALIVAFSSPVPRVALGGTSLTPIRCVLKLIGPAARMVLGTAKQDTTVASAIALNSVFIITSLLAAISLLRPDSNSPCRLKRPPWQDRNVHDFARLATRVRQEF